MGGRRRIIMTAAVAVVVAAVVVYTIFDPAEQGWMPRCLFLTLTGYKCPGCGSQRFIHALLTGHPVEAFGHNQLLMFMIPVIVGMVWLEINRRKRPVLYAKVYRPATIVAIFVVIIAWTVVRNIWL